MPKHKELTEMTNDELIAEKQCVGKGLSLYRLAIKNNEATGYGETANTKNLRVEERKTTQELAKINRVLVLRGLEPEDIDNVVETYGYSGSVLKSRK